MNAAMLSDATDRAHRDSAAVNDQRPGESFVIRFPSISALNESSHP
jgi:hypothetical protein